MSDSQAPQEMIDNVSLTGCGAKLRLRYSCLLLAPLYVAQRMSSDPLNTEERE